MIDEVASAAVDLAHEPSFGLGLLDVRPSTREVVTANVRQVLEPRVMQVLVALARRRGQVVSRQELLTTCWGGRTVVDEAVHRCVGAVRRLAATYGGFTVETVRRVGYRLDERPLPTVAAKTPAGSAHAIAQRVALVGRGREMADIGALLEGVLGGRGALALISGEPGIGKTRLGDEVAARATKLGALVLRGHSYAAPASEPYGPLIEMFDEISRTWPAQSFRDALAEDAAQIATLMPELRARFADIPQTPELTREQQRRQISHALTSFLERQSRRAPLVLVLEDLHWVDEATARVLLQLNRRLSDTRIFVLGTYRDLKRDIGQPFAVFLEECVRRRLVDECILRGLPDADTATLVAALARRSFARGRLVGADPPAAQVKAIHAATHGNPFFIEEAVRYLAHEGRLLDADGCVRTDIKLDELGVSEGMRLLINKRVERLSLTARNVLAAAAVIGARFSSEVLAAMDCGEMDAVLGALEEVETAGLIELTGGGYGFAHDLIRQAVLGALPTARRRQLHRLAAEAIECVYPRELDDRAGQVGHHLLRGAGSHRGREDTVRRLRRAGETALKAYAFEEALAAYDAALALQPIESTNERAHLLRGRGQSLGYLNRSEEAVADLQKAVSIHEFLGDPWAVADVVAVTAPQYAEQRRVQDGIVACEQALAGLPRLPSAERAVLIAWQGQFHCLLRDYWKGEAMLAEAERLAEELNEPGPLAVVCDRRAVSHHDIGEGQHSVAYALRAADAAKRAGDLKLASGALTLAAGCLYDLARWDEAQTVVDEAEPLAEMTASLDLSRWCQMIRGAIHGLSGARFADAEDQTYLRNVGASGLVHAFNHLAANYTHLGEWEEAARTHERELQAGGRAAIDGWGGLLLMKVRLGDRAGAEEMLAERWSASDPGPTYERRRLSNWNRYSAIAEALVLLGRCDEAGRFYPAFLEYSRHGRRIDGTLAIVAAAAGRWAEAEIHFSDALAIAERLPNLIAQAEHRVHWARALRRRSGASDWDRAAVMLREAADRFERMHMPRHAAETHQMLAETYL